MTFKIIADEHMPKDRAILMPAESEAELMMLDAQLRGLSPLKELARHCFVITDIGEPGSRALATIERAGRKR